MITLINDKDKLNMGVKGHQHQNKALLDRLNKAGDKYLIDDKAIRLLAEGAVIKGLSEALDVNGEKALRLELDWEENAAENIDGNFIDLPIISTYIKYDEKTEKFGIGVDFGANEYKPIALVKGTASDSITRIYPNYFYKFGEVNKLYIDLVTNENADIIQAFYFSFIANSETVFVIGNDISWGNDNEIVIEGGKQYEVCVVNNIALWTATSVTEAVSA